MRKKEGYGSGRKKDQKMLLKTKEGLEGEREEGGEEGEEEQREEGRGRGRDAGIPICESMAWGSFR